MKIYTTKYTKDELRKMAEIALGLPEEIETSCKNHVLYKAISPNRVAYKITLSGYVWYTEGRGHWHKAGHISEYC